MSIGNVGYWLTNSQIGKLRIGCYIKIILASFILSVILKGFVFCMLSNYRGGFLVFFRLLSFPFPILTFGKKG